MTDRKDSFAARSGPSGPATLSELSDLTDLSGLSDLEMGQRFRTAAEAPDHPSAEALAKRFGVSPGTIRRKIRLTYLIPQLYDLAKKLGWPQRALLDLSYLTPIQQTNVVQAVIIEGFPLTPSLAGVLRARAEREDLTIDDILDLFRQYSGETQPPPTCLKKETAASDPILLRQSPESASPPDQHGASFKKYAVDDSLFPPDLPACCRESYIAAALRSFRK